MSSKNKHRLKASSLNKRLPTSWLPWNTTRDLKPSLTAVGQERALRAIEIGLQMSARGFNIFVVGEPGSGKTSILRRLLGERAAAEAVPPDICYVTNFRHRDRPELLLLPAGKGWALAKDVDGLIDELTRSIPRALSDGSFGHIRAEIVGETRAELEALETQTAKVAKKLGVRIDEDEESFRVAPLVNGEPIEREQFEKLPNKERQQIKKNMVAFQEHLDKIGNQRRQIERSHTQKLLAAEVKAIRPVVDGLVAEVAAWYQGGDNGVAQFLEDVTKHILENHRAFLPNDDPEEGDPEEVLNERHRLYRVNVLVDRTDQKGAPVVMERLPNPDNLCGYFEYHTTKGGLATDHLLIRPGALHQANGGYLLLQVTDVLAQENAWASLKGAVRHREIRIERGAGMAEGPTRIAGAMKPATVPLDVKVVLVGSGEFYYLLKMEDEDFGRLFKIKAEFESSMPRSRENVDHMARFVGRVCEEEGHLPLHRSGFARLVEYSSRAVEHKERLSTQWAVILDVLAEADFFARQARARAIRDKDVERALAEVRQRHGAPADQLARGIREGSILLRTSGKVVGQINGIALYDVAGTSFGVPVRITARTYAGRRGVVNIDREVELSGAIHDKGALILVGYLGGQYAQDQTLALSASITFEQSYDEIDGDSASSAELYAMLSALSGVPIRQGVAVTGSVNQLGEVQPIGGVNEKIEGIFRVCQSRGLTGDQGVMIPQTNVKNLMLSQEVIRAVRDGSFNIYAVRSIDEGIEVLTGRPAGLRRKNGTWTPGTINAEVQDRLCYLKNAIRAEGVATALDRDL
ncbi:MAG: ATP-binding protein [bacterium]